jgi:hypothetical protein
LPLATAEAHQQQLQLQQLVNTTTIKESQHKRQEHARPVKSSVVPSSSSVWHRFYPSDILQRSSLRNVTVGAAVLLRSAGTTSNSEFTHCVAPDADVFRPMPSSSSVLSHHLNAMKQLNAVFSN